MSNKIYKIFEDVEFKATLLDKCWKPIKGFIRTTLDGEMSTQWLRLLKIYKR